MNRGQYGIVGVSCPTLLLLLEEDGGFGSPDTMKRTQALCIASLVRTRPG